MPKDMKDIYYKRLKDIVPEELYPDIIKAHAALEPFCVRINTIKTSEEDVVKNLEELGISYSFIPGIPLALVLEGFSSEGLGELELIQKGFIYRQHPSSMLAVWILAPQPGERILDMCAAPGSKATQIAAQMHNQGELICIENIKKRYYKLKAVRELMGARMIQIKLLDARRYRDRQLFDRILLDAPCSCEARIRTQVEESYAYWSLRKIGEMRRKQKGLILNAGRLLKPGGILVYVTCTFAPEENEEVVDWFLRKTSGVFEVQPLTLNDFKTYPCLKHWNNKNFNDQITRCTRLMPGDLLDGFFIAKLRKIA